MRQYDKPGPGNKEGMLQSYIVSGAVENASPGPEVSDRSYAPLLRMYDHIARLSGFGNVTQNDASEGRTTRMIFARMSALPGNITGIPKPGFFDILKGKNPKQSKVGPWGIDDTALCFTYRGENLSPEISSAQMKAIIVVKAENLQEVYELIAAKPQTVFALARFVNQGPIRQTDGKPAQIKPGNNVLIMPNTMVGGILAKPFETQPFPPNFNPNPIF